MKENTHKHIYGNSKHDLIIWLLYEHLVSKIPYNYGNKLRKKLLKPILGYLGDNSTISSNVKLIHPKEINIGNNVGIARDVVLDGRGYIKIDDNSIIGFESIILTCTHNYNRLDIPIKEQGMFSKPILIGKDCWIGARVTILPGIKIGDGSIVGTNSVVTKDVPPFHIVGGIPSKIIRER